MRAFIAPGITLGALVDSVIDHAAEREREAVTDFLRGVAHTLPDEQLFPPNLVGLVTDMLLDLADAVDDLQHYETETTESETLQ
jgi:hypothetical protein